MKPSEIRDLSTEEIEDQLDDSREELMRMRFQQATGELTDHNQMRFARKKIARMLTILIERDDEVPSEAEGEE